jgi:ribosomal protein S18 acetylase RimI-like enzyme
LNSPNSPPGPGSPAAHPLDNVIWNALTTCQAGIAEGDHVARRYDVAYAYFAALAEPHDPRGLRALARHLRAGDRVALFLPGDIEIGAHYELLGLKNIAQMIGPAQAPRIDERRFTVLGPEHTERMASLVQRTEPGPWLPRSDELGRFLGVFDGDALVAMAGERMHLTGYREISGVCTDLAWRGRGLARDLIVAVSQAIVARGDVPFLHVLAENATAIALYERLGFVQRAKFRLHILRRNDRALD